MTRSLAGAVVERELEELLALFHGLARLDLDHAEVAPAEGLKVHKVGEQRLDLGLGEVDVHLRLTGSADAVCASGAAALFFGASKGFIVGNTLLPSSSGFITPCTVEKVPFSRGFSNFLDSIVCPPVPSGSGQKL